MARRALATPASLLAVFLCTLLGSVPAQATPTLVSVVSRMTHSGVDHDIPLPPIAPGGIECRKTDAGIKVVFKFSSNPTSGTAATSAGSVGSTTFSGNSMIVTVTGITNAQTVTVTVNNVSDGTPPNLASASATFRVLEGDVNASGTVNAADVGVVKLKALTGVVDGSSFRCDLDRSGTINAADVGSVKLKNATTVSGGSSPNTVPTINDVANQNTPVNTALVVNFSVNDAESDPGKLAVSVTSSDTSIVANTSAALTLGGSSSSRTLTITPVTDAVGVATITVTVSDSLVSTTDTFLITVGAPSLLYIAPLTAESSGVTTSGSGTATLLVAADENSAVLRFNYGNLTTNKTNQHVHGPADPGQSGGILFDIDAPPAGSLQPDGSYLWNFVQVGNTTVQDIRDAIKAGRAYLNVHTAMYPSGELRGHFKLAQGSQTFTPPPAPPALPGGTPTDQDAARWLMQATFGAQPDDTADSIDTIAQVKSLGFDEWFDRHTNPANLNYVGATTSMLQLLKDRTADANLKYDVTGGRITELWWAIALGGRHHATQTKLGKDQLRQRVALAYSEIFVVSRVDEPIDAQPAGIASYHDMLANNAFANFRKILKDVTLHPIMGQYLNMRGNVKRATPTVSNPNPPLANENYAREILQLFSIGLTALHPDGTLKLDQQGLPIATYDQTTIEEFAKVFTGWREPYAATTFPAWDTSLNAGAGGIGTHSSNYMFPMVVRTGNNTSASNHDFTQKVLLGGYVIPANATQTAATAEAELDQALDNIFNHPNIGPFIARRLIQRMVCSNPSPAYIYRVASKFNNNGAGTRGDMKAVIKAILTDYEARSTTMLGNQGFGRVKEPIIKMAQVMRALHPYSNGPLTTPTPAPEYWRVPGTDTDFGQTVYRSPTVFNFYTPDVTVVSNLYKPTGQPYSIPVNAPEMEITTENSVIFWPRMMKRALIDNNGFIPSPGGSSDVRISLASETSLATSSIDSMLARLNLMLHANTLSTTSVTTIKNYIMSDTALTTTDRKTRAAAYLFTACSQFSVQK